MKYNNIKTLKVLEFDTLCYLTLMVFSKNLLHIDTPERNIYKLGKEKGGG